MLWMIGGIIVAVIIFCITCMFVNNEDLILSIVCLMFASVIFGFVGGLFGDPIGYEEPVLVNEIELVSLNNTVSSEGGGNMFYVSVSASNVYTYRYEVKDKYNLGGKSYETDTKSDNVTEVESNECQKPVLKVYERKPIKKWWISFSIGAKPIEEYVFYVPEGTIQKEISLK